MKSGRKRPRRRTRVALAKTADVQPMTFFIPMALAAEEIDVDIEKGILRNVSFISRGPALGHGIEIDDTTLQQVHDSLKHKTKGVKSRLSHPFLEDGIVARLGRAAVKTLDLKAGKVRGDIQFGEYSKSTPKGDLWTYVLGLAKEDGDSIGLSIVFEPAPSEERTDENGNSLTPAARVKNVLAVDVVDDPAANPDGLFGRGDKPADKLDSDPGGEPDARGESLMNEKLKKHLIEKCGLKADATDAEALTFMFDLPADKRAEAVALMTTAADPKLTDPKPLADPITDPVVTKPPVDPPTVDASAERKLERGRIASIRSLAAEYKLPEAWATEQIDGDVDLADARLSALEKFAKSRKPVATVGADLNIDTLGVGMADALCLRAGVPILDLKKTRANVLRWGRRGFGVRKSDESSLVMAEPHERAEQFQHMSLIDMGRAYLRAIGIPDVGGLSRSAVATYMLSRGARAKDFGLNVAFAQSSSDFDYILADVLGKSLLVAYVEAPRTWNLFARRTTAPDFKSIKFIKLSSSPDLAIIPEGGEIKYGKLADEQETVALAKYGKALMLTIEAIINDDLGAFDRIPQLHGAAAARLEDDTVWAILTANPDMADGIALFHASHANLASGGDVGAPTVALLDVANEAFMLQTGFAPSGETGPVLNLRPRHLMVPAALFGTTAQLLNSVTDPSKSAAGISNQWQGGVLNQITEGRLDANSSTGWYMATESNMNDTVVAVFLEGEEMPVLAEDTVFGTGDKKYAVRHTVAAKAVDHRGLYLNPGV